MTANHLARGFAGLSDAALTRLANSQHAYIGDVRAELARRHLAAEALFASTLQPSEHPDDDNEVDAILTTVRTYGCAGCAARVAAEFGDHPDTAPARMRWALAEEDRLTRHHHALAGGA